MLGQLIGHSRSRLAPFNVRCQVDFIKSFNPELLAQQLWPHRDKVDGIAFMALEHPAVGKPSTRWPSAACRPSR